MSRAVLCLLALLLAGPAGHALAGDPPQSFTNSLGTKFVRIAPGTFVMGTSQKEKDRSSDENEHKVILTKAFYLGVYDVTQAEWVAVMGQNPSKFQGEPRAPVEQVSWNDVQEFIGKLKEKEKRPYRLPTEAEWEYACRAGTTTPFYCGATISTDQANYHGDYVYGDGKKGVFRAKTMPVGSFAPNPWGLYDMAGNVQQWCEDLYRQYPKGPVTDPVEETGSDRILRGGSWIDNPAECRSAYRGGSKPTLKHQQVGFRLCLTAE